MKEQDDLRARRRTMTAVEGPAEKGCVTVGSGLCLGGSASQWEATVDGWGSRGAWSWRAAGSGHAVAGSGGVDNQGSGPGTPGTTTGTTTTENVCLNVSAAQGQMAWSLRPADVLD